MQRDVRKQLQNAGIGTKSQQALKLQQEQDKQERKSKSREQKQAEAERMFELKQQKKKRRSIRGKIEYQLEYFEKSWWASAVKRAGAFFCIIGKSFGIPYDIKKPSGGILFHVPITYRG